MMSSYNLFKHYRQHLLPLLLFALFTPWSAWVDIHIAGAFYNSHELLSERFASHPFFKAMFDWGTLPGLAVAWGALVVLLYSYAKGCCTLLRAPCQMLVLALLVGGGLVVHVMLKDHWGRPRPRQVTLFGGEQHFRPYYQPNFWHQPEPSKSFPCGHCSTGFFFFAVGRIGWRLKQSWMYYGGYAAAWLLGILLGWTRIAQGGHFFSDVCATALIMWEITLLMEWLCLPKEYLHKSKP
jgi:lipid A 4'-phosphatase